MWKGRLKSPLSDFWGGFFGDGGVFLNWLRPLLYSNGLMFPRDIFIRFSLYPFADVGILVLPLSFGFLVIIAALGQAKLPQQQRQWVFIFKGINDHCLLPVFEGLRVDAGVFFNTLMVSYNISISICMPSIRASSCCISALGGAVFSLRFRKLSKDSPEAEASKSDG